MRRFRLTFGESTDSEGETFYVDAPDLESVPAAFREQWAESTARWKEAYWNKDKEYAPADALLKDYEVIEVGQPEHKFGPRPTCCAKINEVSRLNGDPRIQLFAHVFDQEKGKVILRPHWGISEIGQIDYCPYCGTKLPEVERVENPPQPIWTGDIDGGYCDTCEDRNYACECNPPTAAYRIKPAS